VPDADGTDDGTGGAMAFLANDGLGHGSDSNDQCWDACNKAHDRCLQSCRILHTLVE
jgi:hypothetical protein